MKRNATLRDALNFSDVMLVPAESAVKPQDVATKTQLTRGIELGIPLLSAGIDNVTEAPMAIALAELGGLGIIHDNIPLGKQVEEVRKVKRAQGDIVSNPITISPESSVAEALDLMTTYKVSGLPVIEQPSQKVVGIVTGRDVRFYEDYTKPVTEIMSKKVISVNSRIENTHAMQLLHEHRIEKLVIVDAEGRCTGLITSRDIQNLSRYPNAARDAQGRLRVGAAVTLGKDAFDRTAAMVDAGLDVVFIDVAHAHTKEAAQTVSRIRQQRSSEVQIVAGNVATADAARMLIDAGADGIKVGFGTGRGAAQRLGIAVPQFSSVLSVADHCAMQDIPVIVDGGIADVASLVKALAAGAGSVIIGDLFAGTDEAPGDILYDAGSAYKVVNPEARAQRRPQASSIVHDPYRLQDDNFDKSVPYRGPMSNVALQLVEGLRAAMAYLGADNLRALQSNAEFVRVK